MRNILTIKIETKIGVAIIAVWATIFLATIIRARANFDQYLIVLEAQAPMVRTVKRVEREQINRWLEANGFNAYGDSTDMVYAGGTPLFDEVTGERIDQYQHLVRKFPQRPWRTQVNK